MTAGSRKENAQGGQRWHQGAPGSLAVLWKVVFLSPRAFLEAQPLVLG